MRIKISHEATYAYAPPARSIIQNLRLTPRSFDSQYILRWRVGVDVDASLRMTEDCLGNVVHSLSYARPVEGFTVSAIGEVETSDAVGVVRGSVETLQPEMFLRASPLAGANATLRDFAHGAIAGVADPLERLHLVMGALHKEMTFDPEAAASKSGAAEAFALKRGASGDFAHVFIAAAHELGIPARYISGYLVPAEGEATRGLSAWAEAVTPGLGWIAFDPVHDLCPNADYVRVAVGFDALSAAPFRGSHSGGGDEAVTANVRIEQAMGQSQN
jgi:transglutaminase-like putative cysteine protease